MLAFRKLLLIGLLLSLAPIAFASTDTASVSDRSMDVISEFTEDEKDLGPRAISTKQKHMTLFVMGITLIILIVTTAVLGISMALYGKQVFLWHMICAGLTVTLALAHGVAAIVWFFPFS